MRVNSSDLIKYARFNRYPRDTVSRGRQLWRLFRLGGLIKYVQGTLFQCNVFVSRLFGWNVERYDYMMGEGDRVRLRGNVTGGRVQDVH